MRYLTTPIYYVNDEAHLGHAYTTVIADTMARFYRLQGEETLFLTGTDEHGQKIEQAAKARGYTPKEYADEISAKFKALWDEFSISYDIYARTTDERHIKAVQMIFRKMFEKGDIYKGEYEGHYCISCESFFTKTQLVGENACPDCGKATNLLKEESYFFRLSRYEKQILRWYDECEPILPKNKTAELKNFINAGLKDLSITRTGFDWGIALPKEMNDDKHIIYVWLDALFIYLSSLDFASGGENVRFFPAHLHLVGKDILKFHAIYFPAFLMSVDLPLPRFIAAHGWWTRDGEKMSKSKGNVIDPQKVAKTYGVEVLRLWILLSDFSSDLKISENILKQVAEQYRKIRNTIRFLLANTNDLEFLETKNFTLIDKWILNRASSVFKAAKSAFDEYEFAKGYNGLMNFLIVDLSGIYLDICKDRLYCDEKGSKRRVSAQSAMALIAKQLLQLLAPTLTYSVDEALEHSNPIIKGKAKDVFDLVFEDDFDFEFKGINDELLLSSRESFLEQIDALKKDKIIKSTLELCLQTSANELLSENLEDIEDFFMVSEIKSLDKDEGLASFSVGTHEFKILKAALHKCPRCWKFKAKDEDSLCPRCLKVMKNV